MNEVVINKNTSGADGGGFNVSPEQIEQGGQVITSFMGMFQSMKDPTTGCSQRQIKKNKCAPLIAQQQMQQKQMIANQHAQRLMQAQQQQKEKNKTKNIIIGVSVLSILTVLGIIVYIKRKK